MTRTVYALLFALTLFSATDGVAARKRKPAKETLTKQTGAAVRATPAPMERKQLGGESNGTPAVDDKKDKIGPPVEKKLKKAKGGRVFDVRTLPSTKPRQFERPERHGPEPTPIMIEGPNGPSVIGDAVRMRPATEAAAPAPSITFEGLDRENWGAGSPPDTTGDVGPVYYIQAVNTSVGIYRKSDGFQEAAFTFDTLMSQGNFGNLCDTDNFGDPVVLYDTFEDRWVLTDFAFQLDGGGNINPPIAYQCFAVSMSGDPVSGGWNFYSIEVNDGLHDYEKLGVWTDAIYMSANMFGYPAGSSFINARAWAINKAQMYAGEPTVQMVTFDIGGGDFTVVPSNARLQTGTPPAGTPNFFLSTFQYLNALNVYKFHVDWDSIALSTFTGPDVPIAATSWPNANVANVPQSGTAQLLDSLAIRAMVQNQYTNLSGAESLWISHTVRRGNTTGFAAPRWYQVNVTGGTVAAALPQAATWDPDAANVMHRWMSSLAIDRGGNMALAYNTSSATTFPSIKYAGRLATDPVNTFSQTEQTMFAGTASQTSSARWGDYSSVMLDPDGCTFWITNQYANPDAQTFDKRWKTRIGSFAYPECTPVGAGGTVSGTVTATAGGAPIAGATVTFGTRTDTTDGSGAYELTGVPAGTYPSISASSPGFQTSTFTSIVVADGGTTTQNFSLATSATSACLIDTAEADFQTGIGTDVDVTTSPGDVTLARPLVIDQQNTSLIGSGFSFTTAWHAQTFTAAVTGPVVRVDMNLFSLDCSLTTMPDLTLSIRSATGNLPSGADLGSATITGFCNGGGGWFTATFGTPVNITSGTQYSLVWRTTLVNPSTAGNPRYVSTVSSANPYADGRRASSTTAGVSWTGATGTANNDFGFKIYVDDGYSPAGNLVSSLKDSNPAAGLTPIWSPITWNGTAPANTTLGIQVAGSNSATGPFNFIGPDGTGSTFFASGASLSQFYDLRYLKYKASLATTDGLVTPALNDVQLCHVNTDCSATVATITPTPANVCSGSSGTATGPAGAAAYAWSITNGTIQGSTSAQAISYTAGATGDVGLMLTITSANNCQSTTSLNVPITAIPETPTITPDGPTTFCTGDSVTLTSSSAGGNQWYFDGNPIGGETNQTYLATAAGAYTVTVTESGCESLPSSATNVTVNASPATPTITPGGPTTFCTGGSVTLTSSSASGNQWYLGGNPIGGETNQTYVATATGAYTVVVTAAGCDSAPSTATNITVNPIPATPTITPDGPTTFCAGDSVTLTSSSASGNQWYLDGNPIGGETNQTHIATESGAYTVVVTTSGCPSAPAAQTSVTVTPAPATPTITPDGPTTFCTGGSVTLTSSSATGNQWYLNGNPIGGETSQTYVATATGAYTVIVTASGCPSAPSSPTNVTVNPIPATPAVTPGGPTTFCAGGSVTLTSSSATGNQWYDGASLLGGETNQTYVATATGNYNVVVTVSGCPSAPSTPTSVTVNPTPETPAITPGGPTTFCQGDSVTLTSSSTSGNQWYLDGNPIGGATNQAYIASATGGYTVVVTALGCSSAPSSATSVTVNSTPAPTVTPGGPTTFCTGGSVTLTSSSATGNQWYDGAMLLGGETNQTYVATTPGNYSVIVTASGCPSAPSAATAVTVNPIPATPTVTPGGPTTFCAGGSVTLTSSSESGNQWYDGVTLLAGETNQTYNATASGSYHVVVTNGGCSSAASSSTVVTVNPAPATPTMTPGGPTTFCTGGSVTLTSSSATGNQWYLNGNPIGGETNQNYVATVGGTYTVVVTASGCASAPSASTTVTVNPIPSTPVIGTGGPTTFCAGGNVTLTSSSASGNQWSLNGNPIGGATAQQYVASAAGDYTVVVTASGCSSAASSATTVTVNPAPAPPTITPGGPTTFCSGGSVTLTSSSATGNQWHLNGNPIGGATNQEYVAAASGDYTVVATASGCNSAPSVATTVTVNPTPAMPTITPGGPTTFCAGGNVTLTSSSASGNQWYLNGNPIGGATAQQYVATATGAYGLVVTLNGCASVPANKTSVTVTPLPSTPTISAGGPTSFCTGGNVTLTSSSASGNQWSLNGSPIGGATAQQYLATAAGDYTVVVTTSGCTSNPSGATTVTINPTPNATITTPGSVVSGASGSASVPDAGVGATYAWTIGNGTFVGPSNGSVVNFTAGAPGTLTLGVTVTSGAGCPNTGSASPTVTAAPPAVTVTNVNPNNGTYLGGRPVTITGTGFLAGASVTFDASAATSVVVVNTTTITAVTPAHAAGAVNVTVTNINTTTGTLTNGYTYNPQQFDANGDGNIDPSDIFYLVHYLFGGGPAPAGAAGLLSGDANGDGIVDPADIFYVVNYLFLGGPQPAAITPGRVSTEAIAGRLTGTLTLGIPVVREGRMFIPVIVSSPADSLQPQALSLRLRIAGDASIVAIRRAGAANTQPAFEITRSMPDGAAYLVAGAGNLAGVIAEVEVERSGGGQVRIDVDPALTLLSRGGVQQATVAAGTLKVRGLMLDRSSDRRPDVRERN